MKVCKFGGSSLANAKQFYKIKKIIEKDPKREIIVVSAIGKDENNEHKITDLLYLVHAHLVYGVSYDALLKGIIERYQAIELQLGLASEIGLVLSQKSKAWNSKTSVDEVVSLGETLSAQLLARYLDFHFADAFDLIFLNADGSLDEEKTNIALLKLYETYPHSVIPGFYGQNQQRIKLLPRGGSDITGSILAAALDAEVYENFSDVSGILMANPKIVPYAKSIELLSFAELRELAFMGASVLHEASIHPIKVKDIPLNIRNTNEPDHPGTRIVSVVSEEKDPEHFITGISGLKDFTVLTLIKEQISKYPELMVNVLQIFAMEGLEIDLMSKGIDSLSLTVKTASFEAKQATLMDALHALSFEKIQLEANLSLIACVGRKMKLKPGIAGQIFSAMGNAKINIRTIAQGSDEISILVGVDTKDFESSIQDLYEAFIK